MGVIEFLYRARHVRALTDMTNGRVLRAEGIPRRCVLSKSIVAGILPSLSKLPPVACELRLFYQSVTTRRNQTGAPSGLVPAYL